MYFLFGAWCKYHNALWDFLCIITESGVCIMCSTPPAEGYHITEYIQVQWVKSVMRDGTTETSLIWQVVFHQRYRCIEIYGHVTAKLVSHQRSVSRRNGLSLEVDLSSEVGFSTQWSLIGGWCLIGGQFLDTMVSHWRLVSHQRLVSQCSGLSL